MPFDRHDRSPASTSTLRTRSSTTRGSGVVEGRLNACGHLVPAARGLVARVARSRISRCTSCSRLLPREVCCTARGFTKGLLGGAGTGASSIRASFAASGILLLFIRPPDVEVLLPYGDTLGSVGDKTEGYLSILGIFCVDLELPGSLALPPSRRRGVPGGPGRGR